MALPGLRLLGCLPVAALIVSASLGCKSKGDPATTQLLEKRCEQLAKLCGDKDKHIEKLRDGCKQAATTQVEKGCADKAIAAYDCYEKELCGKADKVWALEDLTVLAQRKEKCVAEQTAVRECAGK